MWSWTEHRHMLGRLKPRKFLVVWLVDKHMDDIPERIIKIPMLFLNILNMVFFPGNPYLGICHWTIGQLRGWRLQKTLCLSSIGQGIFRAPACLSTQRCTLTTVSTFTTVLVWKSWWYLIYRPTRQRLVPVTHLKETWPLYLPDCLSVEGLRKLLPRGCAQSIGHPVCPHLLTQQGTVSSLSVSPVWGSSSEEPEIHGATWSSLCQLLKGLLRAHHPTCV